MQIFEKYDGTFTYDEMFDADGQCRDHYRLLKDRVEGVDWNKLNQIQEAADSAQMSIGMTFNVYHDKQGVEKILHLDIIPRVITDKEWRYIDTGLKQRLTALNLFLHDLYNEKKILKDNIIPRELVESCQDYLPQCEGLKPPKDIWCHICGTDIIRDKDSNFYVLEDNLRCPSGVSYMLENREIIKRAFPQVFEELKVKHVADYPSRLRTALGHLSDHDQPTIAVLTPGIYNSAYFEHSYLAQQMGVELVTGQDLVVENDIVYMQTTGGLQRVDVIYRRIDDIFIDPTAFRKDSLLGIPGIYKAYRKGNVALANAPGTGVADDKAVYVYVPKIIKYYLDQDPILPNVPTYLCENKNDLQHVIEKMEDLVVKETNAAGGYGMLIGPKAPKKQIAEFRKKVAANPRNYIAQPTLSLSTVPTLTKSGAEPRHVDLRPYVLYGSEIDVIPGALTRVALVKGSLVVNSSQGGGCKDTWVIYD